MKSTALVARERACVECSEQMPDSRCHTDASILIAGTEGPQEVPTQVPAEPPRRGRGRPKGSTKAHQEVAASSAPGPTTSPAATDAEGQPGAAPEPAGPAQGTEQAEAPRRRRGRAGSVSQADGADSTTHDAAGTAAEVQTVAPRKRRGRSSASTSKLNQVRLTDLVPMQQIIVLCI